MAEKKDVPEIPDKLEDSDTDQIEGELDAQPQEPINQVDDRVDTGVEFAQYLTSPAAKEKYDFINKDNVLSYLNEVEINKVVMDAGTIQLLAHYKFVDTQKVLQSEISTLLTTARSRKGFAAKLLVSNIIKGENLNDSLIRGKSVFQNPMRGR